MFSSVLGLSLLFSVYCFVMVSGGSGKNSTDPLVEYSSSKDENVTDIGFATIDKCSSDLTYFRRSIKEEWALRMLDSFGKPGSGVLYGNVVWSGNYEECLEVLAPPGPTTNGFKGRYCWLELMTEIKTSAHEEMSIPMSTAICVPNSCEEKDLQMKVDHIISILEKYVLSKTFKTLRAVQVKCISDSVTWSNSAIIFATFLAFLASLVVLASLYELRLKSSLRKSVSVESLALNDSEEKICRSFDKVHIYSSEPKMLQSLLLCFSAVRNGSSIMNTSSKKGQLNCLHGLRFLSLAWVILCHTYMSGILEIANMVSAVNASTSFMFLAITRGEFSVDTFFLLSGFLLGYVFLKDGIRKMGVKEWAYFYIHRYLRLTPTYALVLGIWSIIFTNLGSGPFWHRSFGGGTCSTTWWRNLLYINNFFKSEDGCMGWSWYLANDMQLFAISPIFLVLLQRLPKVGCIVSCGTILVSCIVTGVLSYQYQFSFFVQGTRFPSELTHMVLDIIYLKPYTRIGPYLIGILVAFCYLNVISTKRRLRKWMAMLGWAVGTSLCMGAIFGVYKSNPNVLTTAFYNAVSHTVFALGVGWVIFACLTGNGGPVNWILSLKLWLPLSRLTYCAYLLQSGVILWYFRNLRDTFHATHPIMVWLYFGSLVVIYAVAFLASLTLESPFISLESLLRKQLR